MRTLTLALIFWALSCTTTTRSIYSDAPSKGPDLTLAVTNNTAQHIHVYVWPTGELVGVATGPESCLDVDYLSPDARGFVFKLDNQPYRTPLQSLQGRDWQITINVAPANWHHDMLSFKPAARCNWQ